MSKKWMMRVLFVTLGSMAGAASAASAAAPRVAEAEQQEQQEAIREIEVEIERARQQLDTAAHELAQLHKKKYALGGAGNKAMLGVLLDGAGANGTLEIVGVTPGGGAAAAGMQAGDRIISVNGVSVESDPQAYKTLSRAMQNVEPGEAVAITYMRGDERMDTRITTQARGVHMIALLDEKLAATGMELSELSSGFSGLEAEITSALAAIPSTNHRIEVRRAGASRALMAVSGDLAQYFGVDDGVVVRFSTEQSELKSGDVLLKIGDLKVSDVDQAGKLLDLISEAAPVQIKRQGRKRTVTVQPGEFAQVNEHVVKKVIQISPSTAARGTAERGTAPENAEVTIEVVKD